MNWLLEQKLVDAIERPLPALTARDVWWPRLPGEAVAVIGMRRSGKTCLLWQQVQAGLAAGLPRSALPLVSLDDERLAGAGPELLDQQLQSWFAMAPGGRSPAAGQRACLFLDEIQLIAGWEGFLRQVIDSEPIDVVITGSSAQMLSAEIASSRHPISWLSPSTTARIQGLSLEQLDALAETLLDFSGPADLAAWLQAN